MKAKKMCEFFEYKLNENGDINGVFCRIGEPMRAYCMIYNPFRGEKRNDQLRNMGCLFDAKNLHNIYKLK